jgi:hypothetical protein
MNRDRVPELAECAREFERMHDAATELRRVREEADP